MVSQTTKTGPPEMKSEDFNVLFSRSGMTTAKINIKVNPTHFCNVNTVS